MTHKLTPEEVGRLRNGDRRLFERVFNSYIDELIIYGAKFVASDVAEDAASVALHKLFDNIETIKSPEHLTRFLYVVTRNYCIDELRGKLKNQEFIKELLYRSQTEDPIQKREEIEARVIDEYQKEEIKKLAKKLPSQQEKVFIRYFIDHKTIKEIVSELKINSKTVRRHRDLSQKTMQKLLVENGFPYPSKPKQLLLLYFTIFF